MSDKDKNKKRKIPLKDVGLHNNVTGEIIEGGFVINTVERQKSNQEWGKKQKEKEIAYLRGQIQKEKTKMAGDYIFIKFRNNENDFLDLSAQALARLTFLATHVEFESNKLITENISTSPKQKMRKDRLGKLYSMNKRGMKSILGLSDSAFDVLYKDLLEKGYIYIEDGDYYVCEGLFRRGGIEFPVDKQGGYRHTRAYKRQIGNIYHSLQPTKHKYLGYILKLLPYINLTWNVVCHNPLEEKFQNIVAMPVNEICEALGYNKSNANRLIKDMHSMTFELDDKKWRAVSFIDNPQRQIIMMVNPHLMYAGKRVDGVLVPGRFEVREPSS